MATAEYTPRLTPRVDDSLPETEPVTFLSILIPIIEHLRFIAGFLIFATLLVFTLILIRGERYRGRVALLTISSSKSTLSQSIAGSLLGDASIGVEPTTTLLQKFADFDAVMLRVADSPAPGSSGRIVDRLLGSKAR